MKTAVIYARSASDNLSGIESQVKACTEYCQKQNYKVYAVIAENNVSGLKRQKRLLSMFMNKKTVEWDVLVVSDFSRITRNCSDFYTIMNKIGNTGINIETTAGEHFALENLEL